MTEERPVPESTADLEAIHLPIAAGNEAPSPGSSNAAPPAALACDAVCRIFLHDPRNLEGWLSAVALQLLRVSRGVNRRDHRVGAWTALIEFDRGKLMSSIIIGTTDSSTDSDGGQSRRARICNGLGLTETGPMPELKTRRLGRKRSKPPRQDTAPDPTDRAPPTPPPPVRRPPVINTEAFPIGTLWATLEGGHLDTACVLGAGFSSDSDLEQRGDEEPATLRAVFSASAHAAEHLVVRPQAARRAFMHRLTIAERQVLPLLIRGLTEIEIAQALGRSRYTIHDHVRAIYQEIGVKSRNELVAAWNAATGA